MAQEAAAAHHDGEHEDTTTGLNQQGRCSCGPSLVRTACSSAPLSPPTSSTLAGARSDRSPRTCSAIPVTSVSTFVLLMSSMSMVLAYAALTRGSLKTYRVWLMSTIIMGATFLGFQVFEFYEFANHMCTSNCNKYHAAPGEFTEFDASIAERECTEGVDEYDGTHGLTPRTNLFGTTFFTLTGLHGTHVTIGVIWLLGLFFYSFKKCGVTPSAISTPIWPRFTGTLLTCVDSDLHRGIPVRGV